MGHRSVWEECAVMWEGCPMPALGLLADLLEPYFFILFVWSTSLWSQFFFSQGLTLWVTAYLPAAGRRSVTQGSGCVPTCCEDGLRSAGAHGSTSTLRPAAQLSPDKGQFILCHGLFWDFLELLRLMWMYFRSECISDDIGFALIVSHWLQCLVDQNQLDLEIIAVQNKEMMSLLTGKSYPLFPGEGTKVQR